MTLQENRLKSRNLLRWSPLNRFLFLLPLRENIELRQVVRYEVRGTWQRELAKLSNSENRGEFNLLPKGNLRRQLVNSFAVDQLEHLQLPYIDRDVSLCNHGSGSAAGWFSSLTRLWGGLLVRSVIVCSWFEWCKNSEQAVTALASPMPQAFSAHYFFFSLGCGWLPIPLYSQYQMKPSLSVTTS